MVSVCTWYTSLQETSWGLSSSSPGQRLISFTAISSRRTSCWSRLMIIGSRSSISAAAAPRGDSPSPTFSLATIARLKSSSTCPTRTPSTPGASASSLLRCTQVDQYSMGKMSVSRCSRFRRCWVCLLPICSSVQGRSPNAKICSHRQSKDHGRWSSERKSVNLPPYLFARRSEIEEGWIRRTSTTCFSISSPPCSRSILPKG
mmetsp:Transcript_31907/g.71672  ORF Transcript_31907/g.71672 Transcript_31907/m.71672 type:complete len:203 (+) Transcript_31907:740-1348(+)